MRVSLYISFICLIGSGADSFAAPKAKPIDPKNLVAGCNEDNAPARQLDSSRLLIVDDESGYVPCDKTNMGYRVRMAMQGLGKMLGMDGRNRWAPSIVGSNPFRFTLDRIDHLKIIGAQDASCDTLTNGYFQRFASYKTVTVCPSARHLPELGLMALMLHEARHADGPAHVGCTHGAYAALPKKFACDSTINQHGSYGVTTEFYLAATKESTLTPAQRQSARATAIYYLMDRFNTLPKDLGFVAIAFPASGGAYAVDGLRETKILSSIPPGFVVTQQASNPVLVKRDTGATLSYAFAREKVDASSDTILLARDKGFRETLVDVANIGDMNCYLYKKVLECFKLDLSARVYFNLQDAVASRFLLMDKRLFDVDAKVGLDGYMITEDGLALELESSLDVMAVKGPFRYRSPEVAEYAQVYRDTVSFPLGAEVAYVHLKLTAKGDAVHFSNGKDKRGVVPGLQHLPYRRLTGPTVWSEIIERL